MSSTSNVQNLFTNVFRPVYVYDTTSNAFRPKLELSNVDTYIGNEVAVYRALVGDANSNVYVGSNAGNAYSNLQSSLNNTTLGYGAGFGISNVLNSTYLGYTAGSGTQNASAVIAIGAAVLGTGTSNIMIGNGTGNAGSNDIFIGHGIRETGIVNNQLRVGINSNYTLTADLSTNWVGVGGFSAPNYPLYSKLDVSGGIYTTGKIGVQMSPSNSLNVNGTTQSTGGFYSLSGAGITLQSGNQATICGYLAGLAIFSIEDVNYPTTIYHAGMWFLQTTTGSNTTVTDKNGGYALFGVSGSNLYISNTTASSITVNWSVTFLPISP